MERKEKRKAVCLKCGWVYLNPHPSAKQRRAHRKRCGATAGGGSAGGGEEKNLSDEVLAEEGHRKNSGIDMERKEKRKVMCLKCGWVYANPHPSAKQRRAHRKHCGATAGGGGGGGAGGGEEKNFSDEVLAEEGRRKNSGIDMERKEKRKAVCLKCGSVYANPHPSAKQRRAHRKHCGATAGGGGGGAGGGEEKSFSDEVLAEEGRRKNSVFDMERKEKRKAVCLKCGWVYLNHHPSARQRRAHRKHCGATAGGCSGGGAGGGEEKNFSDEVLAEEGRRKNSGIDFLVFFFSFTLCRSSAMMFWGN